MLVLIIKLFIYSMKNVSYSKYNLTTNNQIIFLILLFILLNLITQIFSFENKANNKRNLDSENYYF